MTLKTVTAIAIAGVFALLLGGAVLSSAGTSSCVPAPVSSSPQAGTTASASATSPAAASPAAATEFTAAQTSNASIIVATGARLRVPPRGWLIAVAVTLGALLALASWLSRRRRTSADPS